MGSVTTRSPLSSVAIWKPWMARLRPSAVERLRRRRSARCDYVARLVFRRRLDRPQTDPIARLVDLDDLDRDRVAATHDVVDLVDPLAAAELGDVDQSVDALLELDEGAEVGRLDHLAGDDVADLDVLAHRDDALGDRLACLHVGGGDVDRAVVFDVDLHAELFAEPLEGLAALTDDEADLVGVDLDREDARRERRQLGARLRQRGEHLVEDEEPP